MSNTKLKTVGDCVKLCNSAGIKISHLDGNLFETAGVVEGLLDKIAQLEQEKLESVDAWNSQLEKASAKIKGLEQEVKELKAHNKTLSDAIKAESGWVSSFEKVELSHSDALAQHDKEVAVKAIKDLNKYVVGNFPNGFLHSTAEYIKQLQEQE